MSSKTASSAGRMGAARRAASLNVALLHIGQYDVVVRLLAKADQLAPATGGARSLRGRHIDLDRSVGNNDRSDIPAVNHGAWLLPGKLALERDQFLANARVDSNAAGCFAGEAGPVSRAGEM